eukprot:CAMPEP_0114336390 /NCGR_PEP_ID=MMETSP0101-20121206/5679_1 /TAXON_ID=38822 ORGANISM="Pteridomonas danica, Strain PT" /NCGR_SAMPLE_ID=MMETSP0101 /ASSEMBLY_ACC=CAM_ASM_000211 /LENGTH=462 /DNA_ID=CAMNT_0001468305 /DNA_START=2240 /DNA_END=3625 /DNA_ORIENTATION=+
MAKVGRNGRGRGKNGWKGRSTWGVDNNVLNSANIDSIALSGAIINENNNDNITNPLIHELKIETIKELEERNKGKQENKIKKEETEEQVQAHDDDENVEEEGEQHLHHDKYNKEEDKGIMCPPIFEGDYWIDEANRLFYLKHRKKSILHITDNKSNPYEIAISLIRTLRQHSLSHAFNQPVDPILLNIPDYFDIISNPMDFSTISNKLKNNSYVLMEDMLKDIELTLENAQTYNPIKHPVHTAACNLKTVYLREWKILNNRWNENQTNHSKDLKLTSLVQNTNKVIENTSTPSSTTSTSASTSSSTSLVQEATNSGPESDGMITRRRKASFSHSSSFEEGEGVKVDLPIPTSRSNEMMIDSVSIEQSVDYSSCDAASNHPPTIQFHRTDSITSATSINSFDTDDIDILLPHISEEEEEEEEENDHDEDGKSIGHSEKTRRMNDVDSHQRSRQQEDQATPHNW